jgi:hypothetical protein
MYTIRLDEVSADILYVGEAAIKLDDSDPFWRIRKLETTGTVTKVLFADGNENFDNVWADRASLSYS